MSSTTKPLGSQGPLVPRCGLGLMGLSVFYGKPKPDSERLALLDHAYEIGERFWDTADMYGDNEDLLGKWFAANPEKRQNIFLATKFANRTLPDGTRTVDSTPEYAREACERSLKRMGLSTVDLYYVHRVDLKTPIERTMEALVQLKNEGKIKYIGLSEVSSTTLRRAHAVHPITAVQVEYSPFALEIENENGTNLLATARELGVAVVAYSPLGRGLFTGTLRSPVGLDEGDFRRFAPRFSEENFSKNLTLVDEMTEISTKNGITTGQLTLAWLMSQGDDIFPIPGTTSLERLKENLESIKVILSEEDRRKVRECVNKADVRGTRYPGPFMAYCYADTPNL